MDEILKSDHSNESFKQYFTVVLLVVWYKEFLSLTLWMTTLYFPNFRSKFPAKNTQSPVKSPRGQEVKSESPKQVPTRESPVKRERMSPSAAPMSLQQERRPLDRREEVTAPPAQRDNITGTPTVRENGTPMSGRNQTSAYEPAGEETSCRQQKLY